MKKIIASAVGLMLVGGVAVTSASAVESQFGGMWRVRADFMDNFTQPDSDISIFDQRTRLYYTAKFSDNFKFVNRFEIDSEWGAGSLGDVGADGKDFEVKNSYADFTVGMVNTKIGIQGATISRGFIFSADFSGAVVTADFGMVKVPVLYGAVSQEDAGSYGAPTLQNFVTNEVGTNIAVGGGDGDVHLLSVMPNIKINDNISLTPHLTWATVTHQDSDIYWLGVDADLKFDAVSGWATAIYNGGTIDMNTVGTTEDMDISAFLLAAGADAGIVHGQAFYATGDDTDDNDIDSFVAIGATAGSNGTSYYWSEILGAGTFDIAYVDGTLGDKISNIWALNVGVTVKPMDKLTLNFDVWYAQLAEEINMGTALAPQMEDELGLELDAKLTYEIMENLNADVVFAYLIAGEAVGPEDVMEGGVQLSLKF